MIYSVKAFGAAGDGQTDDSEAIQRAIDQCTQAGGGRVVLESGYVFYSSSLVLKPNVDLHVEKGAVLKASSDIDTYYRPNKTINTDENRRVGNPVTGKPSFVFIYAKDAHHMTISGQGTIDGNGFSFVHRINQYYVNGDFYPRPTLIYTEHCNHSTFRDVTMCNVPFWTLHPAGSDDVLIDSIRILNDLDVANSDGIDPDHCTNVRIMGCHIQCADDCICIKTTEGNKEYGPSKNIIVSNCTLISTSAAFKIGTEGVADFENVLVSNCIISRSNRGISIQVRDGGNVRNVSFSDIIIETRRFSPEWWGTAEPIVITCHDRDGATESGQVENIRFRNITCTGENGIFISGNVKKPIRNVRFDNVQVKLTESSKWSKGLYDLRPIPDDREFIQCKSPSVYIRHGQQVTFTDTTFVCDSQIFSDENVMLEQCEDIDY